MQTYGPAPTIKRSRVVLYVFEEFIFSDCIVVCSSSMVSKIFLWRKELRSDLDSAFALLSRSPSRSVQYHEQTLPSGQYSYLPFVKNNFVSLTSPSFGRARTKVIRYYLVVPNFQFSNVIENFVS